MKTLKLIAVLLVCIGFHSCQDEISQNQIAPNDQIEKRQLKLKGWTPSDCVAMNIFISPECGDNWTQGVLDAIDSYNNLFIAVTMNVVEEEANSNLVIHCEQFSDLIDDIIGVGEIPLNDGENGTDIYFNTFFEDDCANPCWFQRVAMHELSHTLGITHNDEDLDNFVCCAGPLSFDSETGLFDPWEFGEYVELELIEGTPHGFQEGSIFNAIGPPCDESFCTFSEFDIVALETLYDPCDCPETECDCAMSQIDLLLVPGQEICAGEIAKLFVIHEIPPGSNPRYEWTFDGPISGSSHGESASIIGQSGGHRPLGSICVTVTTDCGSIELCENVMIVDCDGGEPGNNGPGGGNNGPGGPK
ncbi:MAG: M57 family metalloprotease [Bacteroidota bacterium]